MLIKMRILSKVARVHTRESGARSREHENVYIYI